MSTDIESPKDIYNLDDESFSKLTAEDIIKQSEALNKGSEDGNSEKETDEPNDDNQDDEPNDNAQDEDQQEDGNEQEDEPSDDVDPNGEQGSEEPETQSAPKAKAKENNPKTNAQGKSKTPEGSQEPTTTVDTSVATDFYKSVTAPLKADNHEYTFNDPAKIRELIQKGINYNGKMEAIKQMRGVHEVLSEANLLDPTKLSFLIDLHNRKPEAIAKLLQDSKLDTYELDEQKASEYKETSVDLDQASKVAHFRAHYNDNASDQNYVSVFEEARKWDDHSQQKILEHPEYIRTLADHKASGVYNQIMNQVAYERNVNNVHIPLLDHYHDVGVRMFGNGGGNAQVPTQNANTIPTKEGKPKVTKRTSAEVQAMRKKLGPTTASSPKSEKTPKFKSASDIYKLSPEEFSKIDPELLKNIGK
jgi:hypothetical protein